MKLLKRNAGLLLAAAIAIAGVYLFSGRFTPVRFDRERIEVWAAPGQVQVTGFYHYRNSSPLPAVLTLGVPFPIDDQHGAPLAFQLAAVAADGQLLSQLEPSLPRDDQGRVRLWFRGHEEKWIRLDYLQPVSASDGRYILVTTRPWGRPLERGDYILRLQPGLQLQRSNYEVAASPQFGPNAYSFSQSDFFPDRDWTFAWSERPVARAKDIAHEIQ